MQSSGPRGYWEGKKGCDKDSFGTNVISFLRSTVDDQHFVLGPLQKIVLVPFVYSKPVHHRCFTILGEAVQVAWPETSITWHIDIR
jgi:hypothetical protein